MTPEIRVRELSPAGRGALSVVLVEGDGAFDLVARVFSVEPPAPGRLTLARLRARGEAVDEALLVATCDERVELHLHGNPAVVAAVVEALTEAGARSAEPPCSNAASALELLAGARSEDGARILLDQAEGALARELDRLLGCANEEALRAGVRDLLERSRLADFALRPRRVVIVGPVNAGKSTLFNALTGAERVATAEQEGTTRDAIRELALLGCYPVELVDTAGSRPLPSEGEEARLERQAQERASSWSTRADLVVELEPALAGGATAREDPARPPARVRIPSRIDALPAGRRPPGGISVLEDPAGARLRVEAVYRAAFGLAPRAWQPGRGVLLRESARAALGRVGSGPSPELRARLREMRGAEPGDVAGSGARS